MEGERRKRKLENEEENEEQKMEKFFALIKSTKDVRDLLSKEIADKKVEEEKGKGIWNPTFQPEDFIDFVKFGRSNISTPHAGPSKKDKENEKEREVIEKEYLQEEKEKEKEVTEKEYLQETTTAAAAAAPAAENEDKEKASDHLDLNLSL